MENNSLINKPMYVENNLLERIGQKNKRKNRRSLAKKILLTTAGITSLVTIAASGIKISADYITEKHQNKIKEMGIFFDGHKTINVDQNGTNYNMQIRRLLNELHQEYPETREKYNRSNLREYIQERTNKGKIVSPNEDYNLPELK